MHATCTMATSQSREANEDSPLLISPDPPEISKGRATVFATVLNLMKTCMGTGCLGLAVACQEAGLAINTVGLLLMALWNLYAVDRLCQCLKCVERIQPLPQTFIENSSGESATVSSLVRPPQGTSTIGVVAWYAYGPKGLETMDAMMLILLLGIIVAYVEAEISFLGDTPFTLGPLWDALWSAAAMSVLSLVPDVGYLSRASGAGLAVLVACFLVIAGFGLTQPPSPSEPVPLSIWPESLAGLSQWFGVAAFGYGIVPLTYNFRESMREPEQLVGATALALVGVYILYLFMGIGLYMLFPTVSDQVLHELPATGILPTLTRLFMVGMVIVTAPLLIIPCAQLIQGKWPFLIQYRATVRFGITLIAVSLAVLIPSFVQVLALVGSTCVGVVSFCVPPVLHMRLAAGQGKHRAALLDGFLLIMGILATVVSSVVTVTKV